MSHWKKFESQALTNTKEQLLRLAVAELGLELDTTVKQVSNSYGKETVDMGFKKNGKLVSIGLKKVMDGKNEKIELRGDFWGTGINEAGFIDKLAQVYQKHNIIDQVEENGWTVDEVVTTATGEIEISVSKWA